MGHHCVGFDMENAINAFEHFTGNLEVIEDYGSKCGDNWLHTWDDGYRILFRCKTCGGYLLKQSSEFHSFTGDDSLYTNYFPVSGPEEAAELNRTLDGWEIEHRFGRRYIIRDNMGAPHWSI